MNKKRTLLFSIITILIIGLVVTGGTFAYLQWTINSSDGTRVNVTIEHGGVTMHIESDAKEFVGLYPTKVDDATDCDRTRYGDALVTIVNKTGTMAIPSFKLKVKVTKGGSDDLTKAALEHIRYTVVPITTTVDAQGKPVKGNEVSNCSVGVSGSAVTGNKYDVESSWSTFGMKFESVSTSSAWSHIPATNDYIFGGDNKINSGYLPRQYNTTTETVQGITFKAPQYSTTYQYFRVYVWLDEGYTTTIIGNVVSDPLQNTKIEVMWSEESMVEQVVGSGTAADYTNSVPMGNIEDIQRAPGHYEEDGTFVSWDELIANGDVVIDGTVITGFVGNNYEDNKYFGTLVIPEGIETIGNEAFYRNSLTKIEIPDSVTSIGNLALSETGFNEIKFGKNSKLTTIGNDAFNANNLTSIEIPEGVTSIGAGAFSSNSLTSIEIPEGVTSIGAYAFSSNNLTSIEIPEGVTSIGAGAFSSNSLTSIKIPAGVTKIEEFTFEQNYSLTSIEMSENITYIGDYAFYGCTFTSIEIPAGVTYIGESAFGSTALSIINFKGTVAQWNAITKGENWHNEVDIDEVICSDGIVTLYEPGVYGYNMYWKSTWDDLVDNGKVSLNQTRIDHVDTTLTEILIVPNEITSIGPISFENSSFGGIIFGKNSQLTTIEGSAFYGSTIYSIMLPPSLTSISDQAFSNCTNLEEIVFKGTIAQWNAIEKYETWNNGVPATKVVCIDGEVSLQ